jgi:hypothetical protein
MNQIDKYFTNKFYSELEELSHSIEREDYVYDNTEYVYDPQYDRIIAKKDLDIEPQV